MCFTIIIEIFFKDTIYGEYKKSLVRYFFSRSGNMASKFPYLQCSNLYFLVAAHSIRLLILQI